MDCDISVNKEHLDELRKRMAVTDREDATAICEVMVNRFPDIYIEALSNYINRTCSYLLTIEEVINELQSERYAINHGEHDNEESSF